MKIGIGNDHVAVEYKKEIKKYIEEKYGYEVVNYGTDSTERFNYPVSGEAVANAVVSGEVDKGIVICGTGVGISLAANKVNGIRCVTCSEPYSALLSRQHNNTNMLAFGARVVGIELAKMIVDAWLSGEYEGGRHQVRIDMLKEIEEKVNQIVFEGRPVVIKNMTKEEALASGAMALFDEKYGDVVRVVNIGDYSIELCGGCHVSNSSEIGLFKIVSEESVGSGIRRIVAQSGLAAYNAMVHEKETVDTIASTLNLKNRKDVVNKVEALKEDLKEAKVEIEQLSAKLNAIQAASKANDIEEINGVKVLYVEEQLENAKAKQLTFDFRDQLESGIVVLVSKYEEKCSYFVSVSKDLVGQYKAGNIIKAINEVVDGRGGGKPDFAQGGCAINDNISKIKGALKNIL